MAQQIIFAGLTPTVIIKAGLSVSVRGWDSEQVAAEANSVWGFNVERKKDIIQIQIGGSVKVFVPLKSNVKVYAGKDIDVQGIQGQADCFAGLRLRLKDVHRLGHASAGWTMDIDCQTMLDKRVDYKCGSDLRFHIRDLTSARIRVMDFHGYWEARIGSGGNIISLKCGGDVTLVTDQNVEPLPPRFILGHIERPASV